ncbi:MAG: transcriptional regulator [Solirubrobacterales bacterium]|nr:transcriptional regulator [Solirubrobacterales bacterium]
MTAAQLDTVIHPPARLSICALLAAAPDWVEFATVRDTVQLSDSALSKHSRTLEDSGYLEVRKGAIGRRPRTWFRLTPAGRRAFAGHVEALHEITRGAVIPSSV